MNPVSYLHSRGAKVSVDVNGNLALDLRCVPKSLRDSVAQVSRENKAEIVDILKFETLPPEPWRWFPSESPCDKLLNEWDCARLLKGVCAEDKLVLSLSGQMFILVPTTGLSTQALERYGQSASYLLTECLVYLKASAENVPVLTPIMACECLAVLADAHGKDGFELRGMNGVRFPVSWPFVLRETVQTIYIESLQ